MKYDIDTIKRRIIRIEKIISSYGDNPEEKCNYFGGFNLGYYRGKLSILESILDDLIDGVL